MSRLINKSAALGSLWFACFAGLPAGAWTDSAISAVTVYGKGALVTRNVDLGSMGPDQTVTIEGLPRSLDVNSLRLRSAGYEVVSVESETSYEDRTDRLAEIGRKIKAAEKIVRTAKDELSVAEFGLSYSSSLIAASEEQMRSQLASGSGSFDGKAWSKRSDFLTEYDQDARQKVLQAEQELDAAQRHLASLRYGSKAPSQGAASYNVTVKLQAEPIAARLGEPQLALEYFVPDAAWSPRYDLRANKALDSVELAYHASVRQVTGEDWTAVPITLSTAKPELGASGPDPEMAWIDLYDPRGAVAGALNERALKSLGYAADEMEEVAFEPRASQVFDSASTFATIDSSGLAVRFRLAKNETVLSMTEPSVLLVGRSKLALAVEHIAVPSKSELVWMRGKATNTSAWNVIAGPVAVYVAGAFVGNASLDDVATGTDFELPLGPDQGLGLVRTLVADSSGSKGGTFRSSKSTDLETWKIELSNFGGVGARADGSVRVIVQEVLQRSADEDLKIELEDVSPALSKDKRFAADREEQGILTWVIDVPKAGKRMVEWSRSRSWPKDKAPMQR